MTTQTSTTLKSAGVNIAALLAAYLLGKIADKSTKFVDTRTAITNVALLSVQDLISAQLAKAAGITTTDTTTIGQ